MIRHAWRERERRRRRKGRPHQKEKIPSSPFLPSLTADNRGVTDGQKKEKGEKNSLAAPAETGSLGGPSSGGEREKRLDSPPPFFPFCLSAACAEYDRVEVFPKRVNALFSFFLVLYAVLAHGMGIVSGNLERSLFREGVRAKPPPPLSCPAAVLAWTSEWNGMDGATATPYLPYSKDAAHKKEGC